MSEAEVRRQQLANAYSANQGACVAFIDESFIAPSFEVGSSAEHFYLMTAYVVPVKSLEVMRTDLPDVVGATFWHSTQANQSEEGRAAIADFTNYIAEGSEAIIVSLMKPVPQSDSNAERARASCFRELLAVLAEGKHCSPVRLAIFEQRKAGASRNADEMTIKRARSDGAIPRHMQVLPMSPAHERLLWLADMVSYALYQHHAGQRHDYLAPFKERVIEIRVEAT